jgi:hypothetical protein
VRVRCTALHKSALFWGREGSPGVDQRREIEAKKPCKETTSAEGEGFEPSVDRKAHNGFRDRPVQPLRHPSGRLILESRQGQMHTRLGWRRSPSAPG